MTEPTKPSNIIIPKHVRVQLERNKAAQAAPVSDVKSEPVAQQVADDEEVT